MSSGQNPYLFDPPFHRTTGHPTGEFSWLGADIATSVPQGVVTSQGTADLWIFGDVSADSVGSP